VLIVSIGRDSAVPFRPPVQEVSRHGKRSDPQHEEYRQGDVDRLLHGEADEHQGEVEDREPGDAFRDRPFREA
jgi:hypothetical protein